MCVTHKRDNNWDGLGSTTSPVILHDEPVHGPVRHFILIPHGHDGHTQQVDEDEEDNDEDDDDKYVSTTAANDGPLTQLGRQQAVETGERLAKLILMNHSHAAVSVRASGLVRAKETAKIIAQYLPNAKLQEADPLLNEGRYVRMTVLCGPFECCRIKPDGQKFSWFISSDLATTCPAIGCITFTFKL